VPAVPGLEQHHPPVVLVMLQHADEAAETRRVTGLVDSPVESSVDLDDRPREVGRPLGQEECDQVGDLGGLSEAAEGDFPDPFLDYVLELPVLALRARDWLER